MPITTISVSGNCNRSMVFVVLVLLESCTIRYDSFSNSLSQSIIIIPKFELIAENLLFRPVDEGLQSQTTLVLPLSIVYFSAFVTINSQIEEQNLNAILTQLLKMTIHSLREAKKTQSCIRHFSFSDAIDTSEAKHIGSNISNVECLLFTNPCLT